MTLFRIKNKTRKHLKAALLFTLIITITVISAVSVSSAENYIVLQGFAFEINSDGEAVIHGYDDRSSNVVIPQKLMGADVTRIDDYAFFGDTAITSVSFSAADRLKKIGVNAFYGCKGLNAVEIPSSVEQISFGAFQNCVSLNELVIREGIDAIPAQCFYGCSGLTDVTIPESVTKIGDRAFAGCSQLNAVYIPGSVDDIAVNAFDGCGNIVIYCEKESRARYYAEENNIAFDVTDGYVFILGEVNGDGIVSVGDVTAIQRHLADLEHLDGLFLYAADTNQDGTLNISDAVNLQKYIAKYDTVNPIGKRVVI